MGQRERGSADVANGAEVEILGIGQPTITDKLFADVIYPSGLEGSTIGLQQSLTCFVTMSRTHLTFAVL
jgi:hypothetical protein